MNSFLLTITACIVMIFGALYIAPNYIEWNEYREVFEDQASRVIGREVKVQGNVKLKLLPAPYLEFQKVTVYDRQQVGERRRLAQRKRAFAQVNAFRLWLAIPPLLQGNIKVKRLELADPHIYLRFNGNGEANWRKLGITEGIDEQYVKLPGEISFDAINITRGKISIYQAGNRTPLQLKSVTGQLSAESLKGPYRFAGTFSYLEEKRKLSFATDKQNALGVLKVSSILDIPGTGSRYVTKGELRGFSSIPSFKGKMVGALPITLLSMLDNEDREKGLEIGQEPEERSGSRVLNINSDVSANLKRVEFQNLAISVDDERRPQNLNGFAVFDWNNGFNVKARMKATWLDLDQMFGVKGTSTGSVQRLNKDSVQSAFKLFVGSLGNMGNVVSRAAIHAEVSDAKLGGSQVGNFELHLIKNLERFRIAKLSAQLPGRNHLELSGDLVPGNDRLSFSGPVSIKGISLGALSHWAFIKGEKKSVFASNPYFLRGNISYSPEKFEITDLRGDLNGAGLSGLFKYDFTTRKEFALEIDSDQVDLRDIVSRDATFKSLMLSMFSSSNSSDEVVLNPSEAKPENSIISNLVNLQGRVKLRIGRIQMPTLTGRDISIDGRLSGGQFALRSFKMVADDGLRINGRGQIRNLDKNAEGNVRFSVEADNSRSLKSLMQQVEASKNIIANDRLHKDLSPVRLAITLNMTSRGLPSTDISIAGTVAQSQLTINARHEGAIDTLGQRQLDLSGSLINPQASSLINQLIRDRGANRSNEKGQGAFSLQVSGVPKSNLNVRARLDAGSTQASFKGNLRVNDGISSGQGEVNVKSSDAASGLSLLGIENTSEYSGEKMLLSAKLSKRKEAYRISGLKGRIGAMNVRGDGEVDFGATPTRMEFDGNISKVSLPGMLAYLSPTSLPDDLQRVVRATGAELDSTWSNRPFDTSRFQALQGKIDIRFKDMELSRKLNLKDGSIRATMNNGKLSLSRLRGQLFNGSFSANGTLATNGGPVALNASVSLESADLAELFRNKQQQPLARGAGSLSLKLSGEGLSPLGVVSELRGQGRLRIQNGEIFNFSPDAVSRLVAEIKGKANEKALKNKFWTSLQGQPFPVRNVRANIGVQSGIFNIKKVSFRAGSTQAQANAIFELVSMKVDSEWVLQPQSRQRSDLPGVRLVFAGPLAKITSIAPSIDVGQLSQTLAVREIEQNFNTLKKLDEGDPETIRRLKQQKLEQDNINRKKRITDIDINSQNRNSNSFNRATRSLDRPANDNNSQQPSFSNLGSINKKPEGDQGQLPGQATNDNSQAGQDVQDNRDQIAEAVRRQLEEEKRRAEQQQKKKKEKSLFEDLFEESGG